MSLYDRVIAEATGADWFLPQNAVAALGRVLPKHLQRLGYADVVAGASDRDVFKGHVRATKLWLQFFVGGDKKSPIYVHVKPSVKEKDKWEVTVEARKDIVAWGRGGTVDAALRSLTLGRPPSGKPLTANPDDITECPHCYATGWWDNREQCFRCIGKGYMTPKDHKRYEAWIRHRMKLRLGDED